MSVGNKKNKKEEKHTLNLKLKHGLKPDNQKEKTQWEKIASGRFPHDVTSPSNISWTVQGDYQIFYLPALASKFYSVLLPPT